MESTYKQLPDINLPQRDDLDHFLNQMEKAPIKPEFKERVRQQFHTRYKRYFRFQLGFILFSCISGTVLLLPDVLEWLIQINLSESGIPILSSLIEKYENVETLILLTINGSESIQSGLHASLSPLGWCGLALITAGCLVGVNLMIHRKLL